jgi:hypothetical protein
VASYALTLFDNTLVPAYEGNGVFSSDIDLIKWIPGDQHLPRALERSSLTDGDRRPCRRVSLLVLAHVSNRRVAHQVGLASRDAAPKHGDRNEGDQMQEHDIERQLRWIIDRDLIRELSHRYALAIDSRDLDALVDLFVEDYEVADGRRGHAALREWFTTILSSYTTSIHLTGNHIISLDGDDPDRATGSVYCRCELEVGEQWIVSCLLYRDVYERVSSGWRFRKRDMLGWYATDALDPPTGPQKARWNPTTEAAIPTLPSVPGATFAVPDAWPTWTSFWNDIARRRAEHT